MKFNLIIAVLLSSVASIHIRDTPDDSSISVDKSPSTAEVEEMLDDVKDGKAKVPHVLDSDGHIVGEKGSSHQPHCTYELPPDPDGKGVHCVLSPPEQTDCRKARTDRNF